MTALIGLLSGFGLIITALWLGGAPAGFVSLGGVIIVVFGTISITAVSFSWRDLFNTPVTIWHIIFHKQSDPTAAAQTVMQLSERARRDSILVLEQLMPALESEPFLAKAVGLIVDGTKPEEVEQIMQREAGTVQSRYEKSVDILRRAGEIAPAMGLIGTLIGLVQMLGRLEDPSTIGPSMSLALLTTFYGAVMAHMVFIPLAAKAERNSADEALLNSVYALGVASIGRQENPRRLEMLINSLLPPEKKISYYEE